MDIVQDVDSLAEAVGIVELVVDDHSLVLEDNHHLDASWDNLGEEEPVVVVAVVVAAVAVEEATFVVVAAVAAAVVVAAAAVVVVLAA